MIWVHTFFYGKFNSRVKQVIYHNPGDAEKARRVLGGKVECFERIRACSV